MTDSTTIAPTDQSRAEFEAYWCIRRAPIPMNTRLRDDGRYDDHQIEGEWEAWQAARRAPALASQPVAVPPVANGVEILAFDEGLIEDELRRRQYPSNPRNAARSGWVAACRAMAAAPVAVPPGMEPVKLLKFAVWDDDELRLLSGRKGPAFDCELYAMPDGKRAPDLFTAAQVQAMLAQGLAPGWQAVPVEPTSKQVVLMAGAILHQAQGTGDNRHPYWSQAVKQAEQAYQAMLKAAPSGPAREPLTDEMVLAAARVLSPQLFKHGLDPLPGDGPVTSKRMESEAAQVRKMLVAAHGITAAPSGPAREPLEPDMTEVTNINARIAYRAGWRAAERAHSITAAPKGGQHGAE